MLGKFSASVRATLNMSCKHIGNTIAIANHPFSWCHVFFSPFLLQNVHKCFHSSSSFHYSLVIQREAEGCDVFHTVAYGKLSYLSKPSNHANILYCIEKEKKYGSLKLRIITSELFC
jgi:hypothetical protein